MIRLRHSLLCTLAISVGAAFALDGPHAQAPPPISPPTPSQLTKTEPATLPDFATPGTPLATAAVGRRFGVVTIPFAVDPDAVAGAGLSHEDRQTTPNSPFQLPHAIEDHGRQFSWLTHPNAHPLWDAQGTRTQLRRCQSKRKGVFIGAAIGTAVAGAFAVYVVNGTSPGGSRYITYWMVGGAAAGALGGLAYCR